MTPSIPETSSADADNGRSLLFRLLLPIAMTPILLIPLRSYPVEPPLAVLAGVAGLGLGVGFGVFLDRYRAMLERCNDAVVIVVFVVPVSLLLVGMSSLLGRGVVGYQSIGMVGLVWGGMLHELLPE